MDKDKCETSPIPVCAFSLSCLGMCKWTECATVNRKLHPQMDELRTDNKLQPLPSTSKIDAPIKRFDFATDEALAELAKGHIPYNSNRSTKWALTVFEQWRQARNDSHRDNPVPDDLFTTSDPALLNTHLSQFAVETGKVSGEYYPPATIHQSLCGLLRHMRNINPGYPNFLIRIFDSCREL